ncbi:hypothetical protein [Stieleria varia]|nr:hypothetical protein [Stieleria varia]
MLISCCRSLIAQDTAVVEPKRTTAQEFNASRDPENKLVELASLPEPPESIAQLLRDAKVQIVTGGKSMSEKTKFESARMKLGAETRFQLKHHYRARSSWRIRNSGSNAELVITARFLRANLMKTHEVWFRMMPGSDGFWENPLVLHELDHVKLSSDKRIEKFFAEQLDQNKLIVRRLNEVAPNGQRVNDQLIQRLIDEVVQEAFDQTVSLVEVRYKELDRLTSHGIKPVPAESDVSAWLAAE